MFWKRKSLSNTHFQNQTNMKKDLIAFYNSSVKLTEILTNLFERNHPCHELAIQMAKYPLVITGPECLLIDYLCIKLNMSKEGFENQLTLMQECMGSMFIEDGLWSILYDCLSTPLKSSGAVFIAKNDNGKMFSIETQDDINLNIGDQINADIFPDSVQQTIFQVGKKVGKMDKKRIRFIYYLEPLKYDQIYR